MYNPTKNIEERDPDLHFISHWVPELQGYSLPKIIQGTYTGRSSYPEPILDWSHLRKCVKQRIINKGRQKLEGALATKKTVDNYWKSQGKKFQEYKNTESEGNA
ncbi:MAG: hypothetical protein IGS39_24415 [Calothrix sp. C42_A2020_038]|nr:hypothetical protein [Calothrix sp. C42_A2020_038]